MFNEELEQEIDRHIEDPRLRRFFKATFDDRQLVEKYNRERRKDWLILWVMIGLCLLILFVSEVIL